MKLTDLQATMSEGIGSLALGVAAGVLFKDSPNAGLALAVTAATYASIVKQSPTSRRKLELKATGAEIIPTQQLVQKLISKYQYNLDSLEFVGSNTRKWSLSLNRA